MKITDNSEIDMEAVAMVDAALADGKRKAALVQAFSDALVGNLPDKSSRVLQDVVQHLGRRLVDRYSLDELQKYWNERRPPLRGNYTRLPEEDELAISLLHSIASAMLVGGEVVLGAFGVRGMVALESGSTGGKNAGARKKELASIEHAQWVDKARKLIENGTDPREVSGVISKVVRKTPGTVRTVLQNAGVVPRRNETSVS